MQSGRIGGHGPPDIIRAVRGYRDARMLRVGGSQPLVRARLCRRLRAGIDLRLPAGRLAVRAGRGDLGDRRAAAVEPQATIPGIACEPRAVLERAGAPATTPAPIFSPSLSEKPCGLIAD